MASVGHVWKAGLTGAVIAAGADVAVYAAGRAAGVDFTLVMNGSPTQVGVAQVLLISIGSVLAGTVLAALLARRQVSRLRAAQTIGAAFAVLTAVGPLTSAPSAGTGTLLAAMHLLTGAVYVLALQSARRRKPAELGQVAMGAATR